MALAPDPADAAAAAKHLDAQADGAFGGVHTLTELTKRGGKGSVWFQGREYTRAEWIKRTAMLGGTLAAGEGQVLLAELEAWQRVAQQLAPLVERAWRDGYDTGRVDEFERNILTSFGWTDVAAQLAPLWAVCFPDENRPNPTQTGQP